jgi:hypothetical protein
VTPSASANVALWHKLDPSPGGTCMAPLVVKHGFSTTASFFLSFFAILLFVPGASSFRPDPALSWPSRAGAVKDGRRPSRSLIPIVSRPFLDGPEPRRHARGRSGRRGGVHPTTSKGQRRSEASPAQGGGEHLAPDKRGHADLREAEDSMVAGNRGGNGESSGDDGAKHRRANHGERDPSDCQRDGAGNDADKQCAQDASAAVKRSHASSKPDEERQRVSREREDQPAKQADPEHAEDESDDKHGGSLRNKGCDGRAIDHTGIVLDGKPLYAGDAPAYQDDPQPEVYDGDFARADGFNSFSAMVEFFENHYGLPFEGRLIEWKL